MSDYRDPRDPAYRDVGYDPLNPRSAYDLRSQSSSPAMAAAWFVGIALFIGILIFAFGGDNQQVAETETTPPATQTQPAQPATPPAATPPAPAPQDPAKQ